MSRVKIVDDDLLLRKRIINGNISEVFQVIMAKDDECWYEKFVRYIDYSRIIPFDVYEKFASDFGKLLGVEYNQAELVKDGTLIGSSREAVIIKSFLQPGEKFIEAHSFLKQYHIDAHEMENNFSNYEVITNAYDKKYIISDNFFDIEFLYKEITSALIKEIEKLDRNLQEDINVLMKQFSNILLQDYLLGNSDRSAKNWGIISGGKIRLTPSFDNTHILSPRYVHIHGLNITPVALINFLLRERYEDIKEAIENLNRLNEEMLKDLLLSYEDNFLDIEHIINFVLQRIENLKQKEKEIIEN